MLSGNEFSPNKSEHLNGDEDYITFEISYIIHTLVFCSGYMQKPTIPKARRTAGFLHCNYLWLRNQLT